MAVDDPAHEHDGTAAPLRARRSVEERAAIGRAARTAVPRSAHGDWSPAADRPDPVQLLVDQNADRLPWLVPVRHGRMRASAFAFFRGAARIMAEDLAAAPSSGLTVQMGGDAHLANFGTYASPERHLVFDANDFDETLPGPFEWDLKRLVASIAVCGQDRGFPPEAVVEMIGLAVSTYRNGMATFARLPVLELWYRELALDALGRGEYGTVDKRAQRNIDRITHTAYSHDHLQALRKLTEEVDGELRIRHAPPLLFSLRDFPISDAGAGDRDALLEAAWASFEAYKDTLPDDRRSVLERYRPLDVGLKVVGVGSVGTRCLAMLLEGHDRNDPLFLQLKEATGSVYEGPLPVSRYDHHGRRVVEGQRLVQAVSDMFLGWTTGPSNRHFYVRQLRDWKWSVDLGIVPIESLRNYAALCAWTLARGHARSGDSVAIDAYLGAGTNLDRALVAFAQQYATRNAQDYEEFLAAIESGHIEATDPP
ncbi:MAG: DUF2252 domain-containing protein [Actinomycetota bacterium]